MLKEPTPQSKRPRSLDAAPQRPMGSVRESCYGSRWTKLRLQDRLRRVRDVSPAMQGAWAALLVLLRTYDPSTGAYGNLYSNLLD